MDQSFISGLGNIYVNEVLFMARIRPIRSCNDLSQHEIKKIISSTKKILKFSISKGGSSVKDFKNALGKSGVFQQFFMYMGDRIKIVHVFRVKAKLKKF